MKKKKQNRVYFKGSIARDNIDKQNNIILGLSIISGFLLGILYSFVRSNDNLTDAYLIFFIISLAVIFVSYIIYLIIVYTRHYKYKNNTQRKIKYFMKKNIIYIFCAAFILTLATFGTFFIIYML